MTGMTMAALSGGGPPFTVTIPEDTYEFTGGSNGSVVIDATVIGGSGSFTYLWSRDGIPGVSFTDPTTNPVIVNAVGLSVGEPRVSVIAVVVTDTATGFSVGSNLGSVTFERV